MQEIRVINMSPAELKELIASTLDEKLNANPPRNTLPDVKEILTREEAAELLSVTLQTLHNWHVKGILKSRRIGNQVRYYRSDISTILEGREVEDE